MGFSCLLEIAGVHECLAASSQTSSGTASARSLSLVAASTSASAARSASLNLDFCFQCRLFGLHGYNEWQRQDRTGTCSNVNPIAKAAGIRQRLQAVPSEAKLGARVGALMKTRPGEPPRSHTGH